MAKYRTAPFEVEAVQFIDQMALADTPAWFLEALIASAGVDNRIRRVGDTLSVRSPLAERTARLGDWVIRGADGDLTTCEEYLFADAFVSAPSGIPHPSNRSIGR